MKPDLSVKGMIFDIDRFAVHDGPGIRTTVYLKGCPLRCLWCHSPESQSNRPEILYQEERCTACWLCMEVCSENALTTGEKQGRAVAILDRAYCTACGRCIDVCYPKALRMAGSSITVGELMEDVRKDIPFFQSSGGGVTLTGGEPLLQPEFAYNFLLACNQHDIHTALETTGYARWDLLTRLSSVTNLFLYDVKFIDSDCHKRYTGVSNDLILENLLSLTALNCEIQVRVPCIPGINDSADQIQSLAKYVSRMGIKSIALLPYNAAAGAKYRWIGRQYPLSDRETQTQEYMNSLADICREEKHQVQIGG